MATGDPKEVDAAQLDQLLRDLVDVGEPPPSPFPSTSRFQMLDRLGSGGFGVVYLAHDLATGTDVALKTLPVARGELIYRLKREFRALADLRHENLVSFYELFAEGDRVFFTMEYVPGVTFLTHVRAGDSVDEARLRASLGQLVRGLSALHESGKLHRDVKPSNVLVTPSERVVLLDFGLATEIEESGLGKSVELAGTPEFMSPEHALGEPLSPASDWYSVGVMLYQALTGRVPFQGTWTELIDRRKRAEAPPPPNLVSGAPPDLSELCMALLDLDPRRRPGAPDIAASLARDKVGRQSPTSRAGVRPFVGRQVELHELQGALRRVRAGEGVTVLVEGSSGIGKTALVDRFLVDAGCGEGTLVLRGRCYERERVAYQGMDSLIDDLCRVLQGLSVSAMGTIVPRHFAALVRLFPVLERVASAAEERRRDRVGSPDQHELRRQAFGALRELLARIADRRPLLLHVDDLQWGNLDTAALLKEVLHPPDAPGMLLILSYRSEDRDQSPCLKALHDGSIGDVVTIRMGPLRTDAAMQLVRCLLPSEPHYVDAGRLANEAGGNPLLILELTRFVAHSRSHAEMLGAVDIHKALRARINALPDCARRLLDVVAVAGFPIAESVARRAAGSCAPPWETWHLLVTEHLVRFSGTPDERHVEVLHDRIREALISVLAPERAVECHRGLAAALEEDGGADPEVLARHHEASGAVERARELAVMAASQAQQALAFDRAARLFRWALSLAPGDPADRLQLLSALAGALANAGRGAEAAESYLLAADLAEPETRADVRRQAVQQLLICGRIDEGRQLATETLRAVGLAFPRSPRLALAAVLLRRTLIRLRGLRFRERSEAEIPLRRLVVLDHLWAVSQGLAMVDLVRGADFAARYLLSALSVGEPRRIAQALVLETGHAASQAPSSRRTRALVERLERLDRSLDDPRAHASTMLAKAFRDYFLNAWPFALSRSDEAEKAFRERCGGVPWEMWTARTVAIWSLFYLGQWRELERRVDAQLNEARDRGNLYAMTATRVPHGVMAWLVRDDSAGARRNVAEAMADWSVGAFDLQHYWFLMAETYLDLYARNGLEAWERLRERWPSLVRSLLLRVPMVQAEMLMARGSGALAAATAERGRSHGALLREAENAARRLERVHVPMCRPLAALLRTGIAAQHGRSEQAARGLEAVLPELERLQMAGYAAAARRQLAALIGASAPEFLPSERVVDPAAITRMLAPGFAEA